MNMSKSFVILNDPKHFLRTTEVEGESLNLDEQNESAIKVRNNNMIVVKG